MSLFPRSLIGGAVALAMITGAQAATELTVYTAAESTDHHVQAQKTLISKRLGLLSCGDQGGGTAIVEDTQQLHQGSG